MNLTLKCMRSYAVAIVAGVLLLAGYSPKSDADVCAGTGTYAGLLAAQSCTIGDKTFRDFTFNSADNDLAASALGYTAVNGVGGFWGFDFQFNMIANQVDPLQDFKITYFIDCTNQSACIDSIHGGINGSGILGGLISLQETYAATDGVGNFLLFTPEGESSFDENFTPVSTLFVSKDINANCSPIPGQLEIDKGCLATFSGVRNTVDQISSGGGPNDDTDDTTVPEPASLLLLATGLLGLGWSRRSRRNQV